MMEIVTVHDFTIISLEVKNLGHIQIFKSIPQLIAEKLQFKNVKLEYPLSLYIKQWNKMNEYGSMYVSNLAVRRLLKSWNTEPQREYNASLKKDVKTFR